MLILAKGTDQIGKGIDRKAGCGNGLGESDEHRVPGPTGEAVLELLPPVGKGVSGLLGRFRLVSKVVGPAGERVDVGEVLPQPRWHEQRGDGEVFVVPCGHGAAEPAGGLRIGRIGHIREFPGGWIAAGGGRQDVGHGAGEGRPRAGRRWRERRRFPTMPTDSLLYRNAARPARIPRLGGTPP